MASDVDVVGAPAVTPTPGRSLRIGGRAYPVVLPTVRDPRLQVAAVLLTVQVLGQTVLDFELSIAQILVSLLSAAVLELAIVFHRQRALVWPASALLTGNGVALILRVEGTPHGDWWSLHGAWIFAATACVSLLSKYVIRVDDRPLFNPSNFGLIACFLLLGSGVVNPLDFWWGPMSPGLAVAVLVIVVGGIAILSRLRMLAVAVSFWLTFAAGIALLAASGHEMSARWHLGPVSGSTYWWVLVTSPEILIFLLFMITDPKTAPRGQVARVVYGVGVAFAAVVLAATQTTEFGTKVAVLGGLAVVCLFRPWLERRLPTPGSERDDVRRWSASLGTGDPPGAATVPRGVRARQIAGALGVVVLGAAIVLVAGIPAESREVAAPLAHGTTKVARPDLSVPPASVPPISVDSSAQVASSIDDATAQRIARDLMEDLAIQDRALRRLDPDLVATATDRAWRTKLLGRIRAGRERGTLALETYDPDRLRLSTARRPFQGPPAILVTLYGPARVTRYEGDAPMRAVGDRRRAAPTKTFEVAWDGEHFLIVSDDLPPGWRP
jgi:Na+-translocating ferredoxin:NAD+ oxidoreductase RnfD subunit